MSDVLIIKLVTGEEIIAEAHDEGTAWLLNNPLSVFPSQSEEGRMTLQMGTFMPYIEGGMVLSKAAVAIFGEPAASLLEQYNQRFGKIIVPEKKLVTGI